MPTHIRRAGPVDAQRLAEGHVEAWHETYTGLVRPKVICVSVGQPPCAQSAYSVS